MDLNQWVTDIVNQYQDYVLWLIFIFGILHPLTENPWSFLTLSLAITFLGIPLGYTTVFIGVIIGIVLLYLIIHGIRKLSNDALLDKKISRKILQWINQTDTWRHIIVIGVPNIPTYPIKLALPLSNMSFLKYFYTLLGAYVFLYIANSLLYFGLLGIFTDRIPKPLSIGLLLVFALYIYFGKSLRNKRNQTEVNL